MIQITSPPSGSVYAAGDTILFTGKAKDIEDQYSSLKVQWKSDKDGIINTTPPDSAGNLSFKTSGLSYNPHVISLKVTDTDGNVAQDSIMVYNNLPPAVTLFDLQKDYNSVHLAWSKSHASDFASYNIYRSKTSGQGANGELIAIIGSVDDTTFQDTTVSIGSTYYYQVFVVNTSGLSNGSNEKSIVSGFFITISGYIRKMIADPKREYLYAIDYYDNHLMFINTSTNEVEKTVFIGSYPADLDIDASGDTLYVANFGSTEIAKVDLNNRNKVGSVYVTQYPWALECGIQGRLVYCGEYSWCDIILVNTNTGKELTEYLGPYINLIWKCRRMVVMSTLVNPAFREGIFISGIRTRILWLKWIRPRVMASPTLRGYWC